MGKFKAVKSVVNYALNPLATLKNPIAAYDDRMKASLGVRNEEPLPYTEIYDVREKIISDELFSLNEKLKQSENTQEINDGIKSRIAILKQSQKCLDSTLIETQCKGLKNVSFISFCCSFFLWLVAVSAVILFGMLHELTFFYIMSSVVTLLFSVLFLSLSIKYAFLANGVENNLHFRYANPLEYINGNFKSYIDWLLSSQYKPQSSFFKNEAGQSQ